MRNVEAHLLVDKMDEAVTHYINSHQSNEAVHIDTNGIPMTVQDDGAGRVTVMHQQTYTTQMCRQVSVTEQVGEGPWGEELLEGPIAAIVAHLQNTRHHPAPQHKVPQMRNEMDNSVILDGSMRFNGNVLSQPNEPHASGLPPLSTLPPLRDMKRATDTHWFTDKSKKDEAGGAASPAPHRQPSRKSLPHKKRISRKLKRSNGSATPHQELVVINCSEVAPEQEQILPDNFVAAHNMAHEVRAIFICQECGEYYGDEQLKFYHHLRHHYEPHGTIIIENPVPDLNIDKMTNNCIVDTVAALPDSIVELTLESATPRSMYQPLPMDKHGLYAVDKTPVYTANKLQYSMAGMEKEVVPTSEADKSDLYETLDKLELYNCGKCHKTFRKQKQCEAHVREAHSANTKLEDMSEFSEPEDLMAGIQVCVEEPYEQTLLPHLTVENGTVHQDHTRHWYGRGGACACAACSRDADQPPLKVLKEEVLQRIFDSEVPDNTNFGDNMMPDHEPDHEPDHGHQQAHAHSHGHGNIQDHEQSRDHGHSQNHEINHGHGDLGHDGERIHGHNEHGHAEHEFNTHGPNEQGYTHSEHGHGHGEQAHGHTENGHSLNEHDHGHHNDLSHGHSEHVHGHNEHGHGHNEHDHGHSELSQEHSENDQNGESELHRYEIPMKQEVLRKDEVESGDKGKQYECTECGRVFAHRNSLLYHVLSHAGKQHMCRDCDKGFYTLGALKIHRRVHNGDRPYKCEECGREFRQWSDLRYHKISLHSDKKHFKCEYCGKEFARKYSLNIHVRIHTGEKNYKCDYCAKTFRASSYRLSHMRTHTGVRPYKCELCEKSFRSAFDLRRHTAVHDKARADKLKLTTTETGEEKPPTPPKKIKQVALASTARSSVPKRVTKPKQKCPKRGAPNVTVQNLGQFTDRECEVSNEREYVRFKNVYENEQFKKDERGNFSLDGDKYRENTDGKMHVFTHVEKEPQRRRAPADLEPGFVERLTALYKI